MCVYVRVVGYMLCKLTFITCVMVSWLIRAVGSSRYLVLLGNEEASLSCGPNLQIKSPLQTPYSASHQTVVTDLLHSYCVS